jgi:hypothetical protein
MNLWKVTYIFEKLAFVDAEDIELSPKFLDVAQSFARDGSALLPKLEK